MQALAELRYIKTGCSDARGFAASPLTQAFTVMGLKKGSSGICLDDRLLAFDTKVLLGQGELRGKVHLSHRCFALAAWNGLRLLRRQPL